MARPVLPEDQVDRSPGRGRIVLVVLDGLGGLPHPDTGLTELEAANTPTLDALASRSSVGLLDPVGPGITPGSGPGHLSLFGYDPTEYVIGRGALSALGVGVDLKPGDVAARLNLATFDAEGRVVDRRAGRPSDAEGRRVVDMLNEKLVRPEGVTVELVHEKEHRVVLRIAGDRLDDDLTDTDPLETGVPDLPCTATDPKSERTAEIVRDFLSQSRELLSSEPALNGFLARGFACFEPIPTMEERFGLRGTAIAKYPMYRGVAKMVGMTVDAIPEDTPGTLTTLQELWESTDHDLYFLHFKDTDTRGHDADYRGKVDAIEEIDALLAGVVDLEPDVLVVTGDHSTPAIYGEHSWHPVPTLVHSFHTRPTTDAFGETHCATGDLGRFHGTALIPLVLAHAGRLVKYGA